MVSVAKEDYVRAIYVLGERGTASLTGVARYLRVRKASASEMVRRLTEEGYLVHEPYAQLRFTAKGARLAQKLTYKHRIIELFLAQVLGMPDGAVHSEAHRLEHAFSDDAIGRMRALVKNPTSCPHGQPIPRIGGRA